MKKTITLLFSLSYFFVQSQNPIKNALEKFAKDEIILLKELKSFDIISHDSFTQKSYLFREFSKNLNYTRELQLDLNAYIKKQESIFNSMKILEKQKKRSPKLEEDFNIMQNLIDGKIKDLKEYNTKTKDQLQLIPLADSLNIIHRELKVKFIFTNSRDIIDSERYEIEFGKDFKVIYRRKEY